MSDSITEKPIVLQFGSDREAAKFRELYGRKRSNNPAVDLVEDVRACAEMAKTSVAVCDSTEKMLGDLDAAVAAGNGNVAVTALKCMSGMVFVGLDFSKFGVADFKLFYRAIISEIERDPCADIADVQARAFSAVSCAKLDAGEAASGDHSVIYDQHAASFTNFPYRWTDTETFIGLDPASPDGDRTVQPPMGLERFAQSLTGDVTDNVTGQAGENAEDDSVESFDLSDEAVRIYRFPCGSEDCEVDVEAPVELRILNDGSHLIQTANGYGIHVQPGFIAIDIHPKSGFSVYGERINEDGVSEASATAG